MVIPEYVYTGLSEVVFGRILDYLTPYGFYTVNQSGSFYLDSDCSSYDKLDSFYLTFDYKAKIELKKEGWYWQNEEKNICGTYFS